MSEILTQVLPLIWEIVIRPMVTVVSLALFLGLFQKWVLKSSVANLAQISVGILMSAIGLILFSLGLKQGLVPLGDMVGSCQRTFCLYSAQDNDPFSYCHPYRLAQQQMPPAYPIYLQIFRCSLPMQARQGKGP